jgi:hypothetical protein
MFAVNCPADAAIPRLRYSRTAIFARRLCCGGPRIARACAFRSSLPDPAERRFGRLGRRQMLAVTPGAAWALGMVLATARQADHAAIVG